MEVGDGILLPHWTGVPDGRFVPAAPDHVWHPDRPMLVALAARVVGLRSRCWDPDIEDVGTWVVDYEKEARQRWRDRFGVRMNHGGGWIDLVLSVQDMIDDAGEGSEWLEIKEKHGMIRMQGAMGEVGTELVEIAENCLSERICEVCGRPGRLFERRGWWVTRCKWHEAA